MLGKSQQKNTEKMQTVPKIDSQRGVPAWPPNVVFAFCSAPRPRWGPPWLPDLAPEPPESFQTWILADFWSLFEKFWRNFGGFLFACRCSNSRKMRQNASESRFRRCCFAPELFAVKNGGWETGPHVRSRGQNPPKIDIFHTRGRRFVYQGSLFYYPPFWPCLALKTYITFCNSFQNDSLEFH